MEVVIGTSVSIMLWILLGVLAISSTWLLVCIFYRSRGSQDNGLRNLYM